MHNWFLISAAVQWAWWFPLCSKSKSYFNCRTFKSWFSRRTPCQDRWTVHHRVLPGARLQSADGHGRELGIHLHHCWLHHVMRLSSFHCCFHLIKVWGDAGTSWMSQRFHFSQPNVGKMILLRHIPTYMLNLGHFWEIFTHSPASTISCTKTENRCTRMMYLVGNYFIIHVYILMNIKMIKKNPAAASLNQKCWTGIQDFGINLICLLTRKQISPFPGNVWFH